jgi:hypothetical protein
MEWTVSLARVLFRTKLDDAGDFAFALTEAQRMLPTAGRFRVDEAVMNAVERMERTGFNRLLPLLHKAHLPFPATWIEWPAPDGGGNIGFLCETLADGGFAFRQYMNSRAIREKMGFPIIGTFGRIRVERSGWSAESSADAKGASQGAGVNFLERAAADILGLLLIINSPSKVLEVGDEAGNTRIDAKRARQGQPPLPNLQPIRFDIARFRKILPEGTSLKTQADVAEHFVRGHYKTLETGVYWWSSHVRYQRGEEPVAVPKDYEVRNTGLPDDNQEDGAG